MKLYTDIFKKPVSVDDVRTATTIFVRTGIVTSEALRRHMRIGYGKASTIIRLLEDAGVITEIFTEDTKPRKLILKNEAAAINAALRQLRKGNR